MLLFEENQSQASIGSSTMTSNANHEDRDEVDFVVHSYGSAGKKSPDLLSHTNDLPHLIKEITAKDIGEKKKKSQCEKITHKSPLDRLPIFKNHGKKSGDAQHKECARPKLHKNGTSIAARLLGNTYNTATATAKKRSSLKRSTPVSRTTNTERFHKCVDIGGFEESQYQTIEGHHDRDISARALRSLTKGLGKLLRRRTDSVNISTPDPEYKVSYLGNVLTGWAKGEGCVEKPMSTLWRNYVQHYKPEVVMRIKVSSSGLKATTKQHGLTEYWSHRITHCAAPENFPKVFCWIYRHEGRKLKHELRCHAVLCSKESIARDISVTLQNNLFKALKEFRQDKISRQNARLSLANSVYDNPTIPRRKMLLSVGGNNYKPPLERSKSAPKLMAIEEDAGEEDGANETETTETGACCRVDSLYPAMTLGKRRCRRGHSIRRTGRRGVSFKMPIMEENNNDCTEEELYGKMDPDTKNSFKTPNTGSDEDFDSLLGSEPLIGELMSLFEMKLRPPPKTLSLSDLLETDEMNRSATPVNVNRSLDALDKYSDSEDEGTCFNQSSILAMLRKESTVKRCVSPDSQTNELYGALRQHSGSALRLNESLCSHKLTPVAAGESDEPHPGKKVSPESPPAMLRLSSGLVHLDSDEGSISSGCETASTVTANTDEMNSKNSSPEDDVVILEPVGEKNSLEGLPTYRRSVTFPPDLKSLDPIDSDSEFSDESGFSDFQETSHKTRSKAIVA